MRNYLPLASRSLLLALAFGGAFSVSAEELTISNGTATNMYSPIYSYYWNKALKSQIIIPVDSIQQLDGTTITSIKFYTQKVGNGTTSVQNNGLTVYAGYSSESEFTSTSPLENTEFTKVYEGATTIAATTTGGEWQIDFATPFPYAGGNLVIEFDNISGNSPQSYFYGCNTGGHPQSLYTRNGASFSQVSFLPKITFTYTKGAITATSVSTKNIDFGTQIVGQEPATAVVTVTNTGETSVSGSVAIDNNEQFTLSSTTVPTLAGGETFDLIVTYNPASAGSHSATVTIDLGDAGKHTVSVSGNSYVQPAGSVYTFNASSYTDVLPTDWLPYAEERSTTTGELVEPVNHYSSVDAGEDDNVFPTSSRFEAVTISGTPAIAWNHGNPMPYSELYTRHFYLVSPAVSTGNLWIRAIATEAAAVGSYVEAYAAVQSSDTTYTLTKINLTWDTALNNSSWSTTTIKVDKDTRIALKMKYAALSTAVIADAAIGTAIPTLTVRPASLSGKYIIADISGKVVKRGVLADEAELADITSALQTGVYIIKTETGVRKIMKR